MGTLQHTCTVYKVDREEKVSLKRKPK